MLRIKQSFMITDLESDDMIIGIDWLKYHNLEIDWNAGRFALSYCPIKYITKKENDKKRREEGPDLIPTEEDGNEDMAMKRVTVETIEDEECPGERIKYKASVIIEQKVAKEAMKVKKLVEEMIPDWLHEWLGVFSEESKHFPERKK
ncbi:uncharacterized protein F5147DRAFT_773525 [Suillus discolor]|uniref:Reverse transcriptase domain-containing protein n=1 Tax=Suillus discolor TaxID=1912936 RepID=A0A9P7JUD5_9AGAM|nr:uncharacterized protein F5147DRAFT_773525 [Suillus discolor]KAG2108727.1 hypothetical protein F5147DRAFT_773525 [Suillus discolor]